MLNIERVIQLDNDGDSNNVIKFLERVKNITILASNYFNPLNVSNEWNIPSNNQHGMAKEKLPCNNCGGGHFSLDFLHPCDKDKIKKAIEEHTDCKRGGGCGIGCGGGSGDRRQIYHKKWSNRNDNKDVDRNDYGNGVQNRGNDWMCYCCSQEGGWNTTHTFRFNAAWKRDPGTFAFPDDHDYLKLSGKTDGVTTGTGDYEGGGASTKYQNRLALSEVISGHQGYAYDARFSSFLTDFSKVLEN